MSAIESKVKAIIVDKLGVEESQVTPDASFTADLNADSLDTVELIMEFEKEFGISIPDEDTSKINTVKDVVIPATGKHNYVQTTIDATCTEPAKVGKECTVCKAQKDVTNVSGSKALGHAYVDAYVAESCEDPSGILTTCERCDYENFAAFQRFCK